MATRSKKTTQADQLRQNAVCPFCALLCDDLTVKSDSNGLTAVRNNCPNAKKGFEQLRHDFQPPRVAGENSGNKVETTLKQAVTSAAGLLTNARMPFFGGLGTDVDALRTLYKLGGTIGATLDHMSSESALANVNVMQSLGWYTTTLSEMRNRADVVLIVGADCRNRYGRFLERTLEPAAALVQSARKSRRVIYLGPRKNSPRSKKLRIENIFCEGNEIATLLSVLRAHVLEKSLATKVEQDSKLAEAAEALKQAKYANVVWSTSALEVTQARLAVESISRMVADLNITTRAAGLSLGGDDGGMSAMQVSTWLSGFPLRVSYASGAPSYDPRGNSLEALIARGEIDCLVWIDAFGRSKPPVVAADIPLIFIGHPRLAKTARADVIIPVGLPGIHHKARLVRTDSAVTVPLDKLYSSKLPSVQAVIDALSTALAEKAA